MYAAGSTQKEIVDHLNAEGLRTCKGKPLTVNSIRAVWKRKRTAPVESVRSGKTGSSS